MAKPWTEIADTLQADQGLLSAPHFARVNNYPELIEFAKTIPNYSCSLPKLEGTPKTRIGIGASQAGNPKTTLGYLSAIIKACALPTKTMAAFEETHVIPSNTQELANIKHDRRWWEQLTAAQQEAVIQGQASTAAIIQSSGEPLLWELLSDEQKFAAMYFESDVRTLAWILLNRFALVSGLTKKTYREVILAYLDQTLDPPLFEWLSQFENEFLCSWSIDAERDQYATEPGSGARQYKPQQFLEPFKNVLYEWQSPERVRAFLRKTIHSFNALQKDQTLKIVPFRTLEKRVLLTYFAESFEALNQSQIKPSLEQQAIQGALAEIKLSFRDLLPLDERQIDGELTKLLTKSNHELKDQRSLLLLKHRLIACINYAASISGSANLQHPIERLRTLLWDPEQSFGTEPAMGKQVRLALVDTILAYAIAHSKELGIYLASGNPKSRKEIVIHLLATYAKNMHRAYCSTVKMAHEKLKNASDISEKGLRSNNESPTSSSPRLDTELTPPELGEETLGILFSSCEHALYEYAVLFLGCQRMQYNVIAYPGEKPAVWDYRTKIFTLDHNLALFATVSPSHTIQAQKAAPAPASEPPTKKTVYFTDVSNSGNPGELGLFGRKNSLGSAGKRERNSGEEIQPMLGKISALKDQLEQLKVVYQADKDQQSLIQEMFDLISKFQSLILLLMQNNATQVIDQLQAASEQLFRKFDSLTTSEPSDVNKPRSRPTTPDILPSSSNGRFGCKVGHN